MAKRTFATISGDELAELTTRTFSKSYERSQLNAKKLFQEFLDSNGLSFNTMQGDQIADHIGLFYASLRTKTGDYYKSGSFNCIRQNLRTVFLNEKQVDIINDSRFLAANHVFDNIKIKIKESGKGCTSHTTEVKKEHRINIIQ